MTAKDDLDELIEVIWKDILAERGFERKRRLFVKTDSLLRAVRFDVSKWAQKSSSGFNVICNLGVPGLSTVSGTQWSWVVSIALDGLQPRRERVNFEVGEAIELDRVVGAVRGAVVRACDDFLFAFDRPHELYQLMVDGWTRLDEWIAQPASPILRYELGAGYARFLGLTNEEAELRTRLADAARESDLDDLVPEIAERLDAVPLGAP